MKIGSSPLPSHRHVAGASVFRAAGGHLQGVRRRQAHRRRRVRDVALSRRARCRARAPRPLRAVEWVVRRGDALLTRSHADCRLGLRYVNETEAELRANKTKALLAAYSVRARGRSERAREGARCARRRQRRGSPRARRSSSSRGATTRGWGDSRDANPLGAAKSHTTGVCCESDHARPLLRRHFWSHHFRSPRPRPAAPSAPRPPSREAKRGDDPSREEEYREEITKAIAEAKAYVARGLTTDAVNALRGVTDRGLVSYNTPLGGKTYLEVSRRCRAAVIRRCPSNLWLSKSSERARPSGGF